MQYKTLCRWHSITPHDRRPPGYSAMVRLNEAMAGHPLPWKPPEHFTCHLTTTINNYQIYSSKINSW